MEGEQLTDHNNTPGLASSEGVLKRADRLYEFEREPVTKDRFESARHFAAVFSGEHVAGTEFVIGALFVSWGVGAPDLILGLIIGNLLAVLSWTFVCGPIAVETRLTLYWYLRRIAGPVVTLIYNVLNAILFCILSGTMITVSAPAVRIPLGIPPQTLWYPEDYRFVLVVLCVGVVVVTVAILGFRRLAQFAAICVPWIFVMFFAGAAAILPGLLRETPEVSSLSSMEDFWQLAALKIWDHRSGESLRHGARGGIRVDLQPGIPRRFIRHGGTPFRAQLWVRRVLGVRHVPGPLLGVDLCGNHGGRRGGVAEDAHCRSRPRGRGVSMSRLRRDHLCHFVGLGHVQSHALSGRIGSTDDHARLAPMAGDLVGWRVYHDRRVVSIYLRLPGARHESDVGGEDQRTSGIGARLSDSYNNCQTGGSPCLKMFPLRSNWNNGASS